MARAVTGKAAIAGALLALSASAPVAAQDTASVTLAKETTGSPPERAAAMLAQMTQAEKLTLLEGYFGTDFASNKFTAPPAARGSKPFSA